MLAGGQTIDRRCGGEEQSAIAREGAAIGTEIVYSRILVIDSDGQKAVLDVQVAGCEHRKIGIGRIDVEGHDAGRVDGDAREYQRGAQGQTCTKPQRGAALGTVQFRLIPDQHRPRNRARAVEIARIELGRAMHVGIVAQQIGRGDRRRRRTVYIGTVVEEPDPGICGVGAGASDYIAQLIITQRCSEYHGARLLNSISIQGRGEFYDRVRIDRGLIVAKLAVIALAFDRAERDAVGRRDVQDPAAKTDMTVQHQPARTGDIEIGRRPIGNDIGIDTDRRGIVR